MQELKEEQAISCPGDEGRITRANSPLIKPSASNPAELEEKCVFCNQRHKKIDYERQPLYNAATNSFEENIRAYAEILGDKHP